MSWMFLTVWPTSRECNPDGNQKIVMCIGGNAKDLERLANFIDWLYSPEGIMIGMAQNTEGTAGPQGLTWELDDQGNPYLTEFGIQAFFDGSTAVPEEWGGGTWEDGVSALNYKPVSRLDLTPNGYSYDYSSWLSVLSMDTSLPENGLCQGRSSLL